MERIITSRYILFWPMRPMSCYWGGAHWSPEGVRSPILSLWVALWESADFYQLACLLWVTTYSDRRSSWHLRSTCCSGLWSRTVGPWFWLSSPPSSPQCPYLLLDSEYSAVVMLFWVRAGRNKCYRRERWAVGLQLQRAYKAILSYAAVCRWEVLTIGWWWVVMRWGWVEHCLRCICRAAWWWGGWVGRWGWPWVWGVDTWSMRWRG